MSRQVVWAHYLWVGVSRKKSGNHCPENIIERDASLRMSSGSIEYKESHEMSFLFISFTDWCDLVHPKYFLFAMQCFLWIRVVWTTSLCKLHRSLQRQERLSAVTSHTCTLLQDLSNSIRNLCSPSLPSQGHKLTLPTDMCSLIRNAQPRWGMYFASWFVKFTQELLLSLPEKVILGPKKQALPPPWEGDSWPQKNKPRPFQRVILGPEKTSYTPWKDDSWPKKKQARVPWKGSSWPQKNKLSPESEPGKGFFVVFW